MKTCTVCKETKSVAEFYSEGTKPDGVTKRYKSACRTCHKATVRAHRRANAPAISARAKVRYAATGAAQQKARAKDMREHHFFRWRARLWSGRWKVKVTPVQLARLWLDQRGLCALSGRPLSKDAHLDHVIPASAGGVHDIRNLRWLDPVVNVARQNMSDEQFQAMCRSVAEWLCAQCMATLDERRAA